jgi:hypothetical protein
VTLFPVKGQWGPCDVVVANGGWLGYVADVSGHGIPAGVGCIGEGDKHVWRQQRRAALFVMLMTRRVPISRSHLRDIRMIAVWFIDW